MARHDFTPSLATHPSENGACTLDGSTVPTLGLVQLEAIKSIMNRRVLSAVANISDRITKLAAIVTVYRRLGADLLARFSVPDVVDIPAEQFVAACEFLEAALVNRADKVGAQEDEQLLIAYFREMDDRARCITIACAKRTAEDWPRDFVIPAELEEAQQGVSAHAGESE